MQQLSKPGSETQIYDDTETMTIIDHDACYLYHKYCGGLLMVHPLVLPTKPERFRETRMLVRGIVRLCRCVQPAVEETYTTRQLLADMYIALAQCHSMEDVRLMVKEMASREEMREYERL